MARIGEKLTLSINSFNAYGSEMTVLGIIMMFGNKQLREISGLLKPEHFGNDALALAYEKALEVDFSGSEVDAAKVMEAAGDRDVIIKACELAITPTSLKYHAKKILEAYKLRTAYRLMQEFGTGDIESADAYLLEFSDALEKLTFAGNEEGIADFAKALEAAKNTMFSPISPKRLSLGFSSADRILGGIDDSDYLLIAARPSVGKSAFAASVAMYLAGKGKKILYISLEMPRQQIIERMTAKLGGARLDEIRGRVAASGQEGDIVKAQIEDGIDRMKGWDIDIHDSGAITPRRIMHLMRSKKYDAVMIDHIGLMAADEKTNSREQELSKISRNLRMIAMQTGVPIIALSQLNRAVEQRNVKRVQLSDLRDSGSLEQDATAVIGLSRLDENKILLEVLKNRNGRCGTQIFSFDGEKMQFFELEERFEEEPRRGMARYA